MVYSGTSVADGAEQAFFQAGSETYLHGSSDVVPLTFVARNFPLKLSLLFCRASMQNSTVCRAALILHTLISKVMCQVELCAKHVSCMSCLLTLNRKLLAPNEENLPPLASKKLLLFLEQQMLAMPFSTKKNK